MSYYVCNNENCACCGKKETVTRELFKYVTGIGLIGEKAECPCCGKIREYVNPDSDIPLSEKNIGFGMYSSASTEQKREMLRKRSHEHFDKKIKEKKDHLMNQAITEMRGLNKK